ncbi:molybdate transport system ATP-binding protein [Flavobacterium nitrogenifigens]|uniref:Molybdate transport system ATP-binding protein n=2 Tax=Flavobacterium TaxID=237 RepID=A0A7W7N7C7_9FLAO|nr:MULTISPECIES: ATP-binding cassette domain-containing protein [Flavobacterium]MBB4802623.1 molybdate transport system ATP-binding protein [Flavobacterium nitrogenifigens]MBB6387581.1 molybdate transport system ATP-binding protein [Flavobacterium notoginsengisoli]
MIQIDVYKMLQTADGELPLDISLAIKKGQFVSIYGNSGAGKTTILRVLSGLTKAEKVNIKVEESIWDDSNKKFHLPIQKRSIGFVFQDFALFPNLTVKENLEFALSKNDSKEIVSELIELMELQSLQNSKTENLSGGQKQRVALARAIVRKPEILLLDEPLSALDDEMRFKLQDYILKIHQKYNLTTIMVSHSIPEIFKLSDQVIVVDKGKIVKEGTPETVFTEQKVSSKFQLTGEIINITKSDIVYVVQISSGNNIIKVVATEDEVKEYKIGQKVLVASKAFNPIIQVLI